MIGLRILAEGRPNLPQANADTLDTHLLAELRAAAAAQLVPAVAEVADADGDDNTEEEDSVAVAFRDDEVDRGGSSAAEADNSAGGAEETVADADLVVAALVPSAPFAVVWASVVRRTGQL